MAVKYGIIGCGAIAQRRHIPEAAANPDAQVVALADINRARVQQVAEKYGATPYTDYRKVIAADVDAVVVCTPNVYHAPMTIEALNAGKHVLVEKPMATTRAEARAMIAAAKKNKKYLMVAHNQRLMRPHIKAKQILDSGVLGKPLVFRTSFKHPGTEGWSIDGADSWFINKKLAVMGVVGDLGVHKADLVRWLLGQEFTEVCGFVSTVDKRTPRGKPIPLEDNACFILKTSGGAIGSLEVSWTSYGMEDNQTVIYCQNGTLYLGADPVNNLIVQYKDGEKELHQAGRIATNTRQVSSGVIDLFTDCILTRTPPPINGEEGYRSVNVVLTAIEAAKTGKTLKIR